MALYALSGWKDAFVRNPTSKQLRKNIALSENLAKFDQERGPDAVASGKESPSDVNMQITLFEALQEARVRIQLERADNEETCWGSGWPLLLVA